MKKWLVGFAAVAVAVAIFLAIGRVFGNDDTVTDIWNSANSWIGTEFSVGEGIQLD